jgi:hypothetical protein
MSFFAALAGIVPTSGPRIPAGNPRPNGAAQAEIGLAKRSANKGDVIDM